jgi:hypothetical protein
MVAATSYTLAAEQHVRPGAYLLDVDGKLYAVLDRRVNSLIGGAEALVEDVATPAPAQRYVERARHTVQLSSGRVVDCDADTSTAWVPVFDLLGCELIRPPARLGVTAFHDRRR